MRSYLALRWYFAALYIGSLVSDGPIQAQTAKADISTPTP
jgi:hypothetical protein